MTTEYRVIEKEEYMAVGKVIPRVDALEKVTGKALFTADFKLPGMLYGKALRSTYAHARIMRIDTSRAEKVQGVKAVVTGKDMAAIGGEAIRDQPFLAIDKVRFVGEPVAAVAAVDLETAEEAVNLIEVDYEVLPPVFGGVEAMKSDAPLVHENIGDYLHIPAANPIKNTNICSYLEYSKGDAEDGFLKADYIFEDIFSTHIVQHGAIETHAAIAQVDPNGNITVWVTNDSPHRLRKDLADALKIPLRKVRVIAPYLGGGFGGKGGIKVEAVSIALAMRTKGRPVIMVMDRVEEAEASLTKHSSHVEIKTGVTKDGTIAARQMKIVYDTGAYAEKGPTVLLQACAVGPGPYRIPHVKVEGYCVYTNKVVAGAYRGYGIPQITWAYESQMDIIAKNLGIDPLEMRLKNALEEGDETATGPLVQGVGLKECIKRAAEAIGWGEECKERNRGIGIACTYKNTKTPSGSAAYLTLDFDGSVTVLVSTVEIGQGCKTIYSQIASEELSLPIENIKVVTSDTDITPFDASTTSSRSTFHVGNAIRLAAADVRTQLFTIASRTFDVNLDQLSIGEGKIFVKGEAEKEVKIVDLIRRAYGAGASILGRGFYYPDMSKIKTGLYQGGGMWSGPSIFWMFAAHAAEVEIDPETGEVSVLKIAAAHDVGKAIDPLMVEQQIEGGVLHGLGITILEEMILDEGRVLNPSFTDYALPTAEDAPQIIPIIVEVPDPSGPYGAKGIGEPTKVPTSPAIANAIDNAIGVRIRDLPITQDKILKTLANQN